MSTESTHPAEGGQPPRLPLRTVLLVLAIALVAALIIWRILTSGPFDADKANWWPDELPAASDCSLADNLTGRDFTIALSLCSFPGVADVISVTACPDGRFGVRIEHDDEGVIFATHMGVRFHPVDTLEGRRKDGHDPRTMLTGAEVVGDAQVLVLDTGEHLKFARAIIAAMLDTDGAAVDLSAAKTPVPSVASGTPGAATSTPGAGLDDDGDVVGEAFASTIIYDDVGLFDGSDDIDFPVDVPLFTEADVADALNGLADRLEATEAKENVIINMSFGVYNCGEPPPLLEAAMLRLTGETFNDERGDVGVRFVASAGNDETDAKVWPAAFADEAAYPQFDGHVIAVGSVQSDGVTRSCFSNHGPWVGSWLPGEEVRPSGRGTWSGTSFAAPQAAAMLAMGVDPTNPAMAYGTEPNPPSNEHAWTIRVPAAPNQQHANPAVFESSCDPDGPYAYRNSEVVTGP